MDILRRLKTSKVSPHGLGRSKWILAVVLFLISALNYGDRSVLSSIVPVLQSNFHLSDIQIGLLSTVFLWTYAMSVLFGGYLGDALSRSRLITVSLTAWSVATLLAGLSHTFTQLLLCRLLLGLAESLYIPAALALIADYHDTDTRGMALAINLSGMNAGLIAGAVVGGWMAERYPWQSSFLALGILGLIMVPLSWLFINDAASQTVDQHHRSQPLFPAVVQLFRCRSYLLIVLAAMFASSGVWIFWTWLPLFYHDAFHMSLSASGFSGTFMIQASSMAAIVIGGHFSDRIGANNPKRRLLALTIFSFVSVPFLAVFWGTQGFTLVSTGIFLSSFIRSFGQGNETPLICDLLQPQFRSIGLGFSLAAQVAGGGVAVLIAAYIKHHYGLSFAFLCTAGFGLLSAFSTLIARVFYVEKDLRRLALSDREYPDASPVY